MFILNYISKYDAHISNKRKIDEFARVVFFMCEQHYTMQPIYTPTHTSDFEECSIKTCIKCALIIQGNIAFTIKGDDEHTVRDSYFSTQSNKETQQLSYLKFTNNSIATSIPSQLFNNRPHGVKQFTLKKSTSNLSHSHKRMTMKKRAPKFQWADNTNQELQYTATMFESSRTNT